ncbi:hypothetical protein L7F22_018849 [Adiantum nelumboides]|nr:hypothetical protein [Adiantum nelumboides]
MQGIISETFEADAEVVENVGVVTALARLGASKAASTLLNIASKECDGAQDVVILPIGYYDVPWSMLFSGTMKLAIRMGILCMICMFEAIQQWLLESTGTI